MRRWKSGSAHGGVEVPRIRPEALYAGLAQSQLTHRPRQIALMRAQCPGRQPWTGAGVPEARRSCREGDRAGDSGVLEVQECVHMHCARWSRRRRSKAGTQLVFGRPEELSGPARGRQRRGR